MADTTLSNVAAATGKYHDLSTSLKSNTSVVLLVDGLEIIKEADQEVWVSGDLTYTITVANAAEHPLEDTVVTDTLDPSIVTLVSGSVTLNGVATDNYTYDSDTGLLTVNVSSIGIGETAVIMFQVEKV